jgi:hypothetical protein
MNIDEWVKKTDLSSSIARRAALLVGRDGVSPTKADGSGVFVGDRLIMTARHVVQWYWDSYNNPRVRMDRPGKKMADFEMFAVQPKEITSNQRCGLRASFRSVRIPIWL